MERRYLNNMVNKRLLVHDWFDSSHDSIACQLTELERQVGISHEVNNGVVVFSNIHNSIHPIALELDGVKLECGTWRVLCLGNHLQKAVDEPPFTINAKPLEG